MTDAAGERRKRVDKEIMWHPHRISIAQSPAYPPVIGVKVRGKKGGERVVRFRKNSSKVSTKILTDIPDIQ